MKENNSEADVIKLFMILANHPSSWSVCDWDLVKSAIINGSAAEVVETNQRHKTPTQEYFGENEHENVRMLQTFFKDHRYEQPLMLYCNCKRCSSWCNTS